MSTISQHDLLQALQGLSPEQLSGILAQGHGRSPMRPRQLLDLRPLPTAQDPRPTFYVTEPPRDVAITHTPYPRLRWHVESQQEITVLTADDPLARSTLYTDTPPNQAPLDPIAAVKAQFDALSPDDQAFVLQFQREQRIKAVTSQMATLNPAQMAAALSVSTPAKRK